MNTSRVLDQKESSIRKAMIEDLREFISDNNLFSKGDVEAYNKMLNLLKEGSSFELISYIICFLSDDSAELTSKPEEICKWLTSLYQKKKKTIQ